MKNITKLLRKDLGNFSPYEANPTLEQISQEIGIAGKDIIKLDTGENPYLEKLQSKKVLRYTSLYMYPDPLSLELRKAISDYTNISPTMIACGNGSDEIIDLVVRLFISPGDEMIILPPTFPMYSFYGSLTRATIKPVLRNSDLSISVPKIIKSITPKTKIIFIDTPGNPTGTITSSQEIETILKQNVIVVSDEAYFEYCGITAQPLLQKYPNLIIIRTLSKWAGLAGIRVGYLLADPKVIEKLLAIKAPYNVTALSQIVATAALKNSGRLLKELKKMTDLRNKFVTKLQKFSDLKVYPSQGAYIIIKPRNSAKKLQKFLKSKGILVKLINQPVIEQSPRINICREKEIKRVLESLSDFYKK